MPRNRGFSLLEMLVTTALSTSLLLGFLGTAGRLQGWSSDLSLAHQRDENLWLAPLLLTRWILHAGNNRWMQVWPGVTWPEGVLKLTSDIDGPEGFPDEKLIHSFERLTIRSAKGNLQLKSGDGSFQPLIRHIDRFAANATRFPLLSIELESVPERAFRALPGDPQKSVQLQCLLRSYRPNLLPERLE